MGAADGAKGAAGGAAMGATLGPWGALAGGVAGGIAGWFLGDEAADAKREAGLERAGRANAQNEQTLGQTTALAGVSGVELGSGSLQLHLDRMAQEFRRQNEWNVRQAEQGADLDALGNGLNLASNLGSSLFRFGESQKWFGLGGG